MTKWRVLLIAAVVAGTYAWAIREPNVDKVDGNYPQWFTKGFYVGNESTNPQQNTRNKVTKMPVNATRLNYDFAPITGTHSACLTAVTKATVTGCGFGDTVVMGADQTIVADIVLFPYVSAANEVSLRACAAGITDAGTADMPDASYDFRCISAR